jgi:hypothetical protein
MNELKSTKSLQDIWIMRKEGTVLFKRTFKETLNEQFFGCLMSTMDTFARTLDERGLSNITIGNKTFLIKKAQDLIFVANFDKKTNQKKVAAELEHVSEKFFSSYQAELQRFQGNVDVFKNFDKQITDSKRTILDEIEHAFW